MTGHLVQMPFEEYRAAAGVNASTLNAFARSPAYAKLRQEEDDEPTKQMRIGTLVHQMILEPPVDWKLETTKDKEIVQAYEMATSLRENQEFQNLYGACLHREASIFWTLDGHRCKARVDMIGPGWITEVKTCRDLTRFSPWQITDYRYHVQAGWYQIAVEQEIDRFERFYFAVVQSSAPYETCVFELHPESLAAGRADAEALFAAYVACEASGNWTRHYAGIKMAQASWTELNTEG